MDDRFGADAFFPGRVHSAHRTRENRLEAEITSSGLALVASLPLSDADRAAVLDRVIHDMTNGKRRTGGYPS